MWWRLSLISPWKYSVQVNDNYLKPLFSDKFFSCVRHNSSQFFIQLNRDLFVCQKAARIWRRHTWWFLGLNRAVSNIGSHLCYRASENLQFDTLLFRLKSCSAAMLFQDGSQLQMAKLLAKIWSLLLCCSLFAAVSLQPETECDWFSAGIQILNMEWFLFSMIWINKST